MGLPIPNLSAASNAFGQARSDAVFSTGDIFTGGGGKTDEKTLLILGGIALLAIVLFKKK
jgi:hypothetical protein